MDANMNPNLTMAAQGRFGWGTQLRIECLGDWSDGQIADLAMIAHEEMAGKHRHFDWEAHARTGALRLL